MIFYDINSLFVGHPHRKTEVQRFSICCCWPFPHQITLPIYLSTYSRECVNFCYALLAGRGNGTAYRAGCMSVFLSVYVCVWRSCIASKPIDGSRCFLVWGLPLRTGILCQMGARIRPLRGRPPLRGEVLYLERFCLACGCYLFSVFSLGLLLITVGHRSSCWAELFFVHYSQSVFSSGSSLSASVAFH